MEKRTWNCIRLKFFVGDHIFALGTIVEIQLRQGVRLRSGKKFSYLYYSVRHDDGTYKWHKSHDLMKHECWRHECESRLLSCDRNLAFERCKELMKDYRFEGKLTKKVLEQWAHDLNINDLKIPDKI